MLVAPNYLDMVSPINAEKIKLSFIFSYLLLFPWQITGLWRSVVRHIKGSKSLFSAWSAAVLTIVKIILILLIWYEGEMWRVISEKFYSVGNPYQENDYYVNLSQVYENTIHIEGDLSTGVSRAFSSLLDENTQVKTIILNSRGGSSSEGHKLFKIISSNKLNTYVLTKCSSGCAIAFIGGKERHISPKAKLGFHQPGSPYLEEIELSEKSLARSLRQIKRLFGQQGIDEEFINKTYQVNPKNMWYPSHQELLEYGVIHKVIKL